MPKRKQLVEFLYPKDEMTRYGFISHMESYIKQLLTNPTKAKVDSYLIQHGINNEKALSLLLNRVDPSDENSSVLIRTERIRPDEENGKDMFHIKYKLPRKDYMKKMRNLYINTFESHIIKGTPLNEMNANELDSNVKKKESDGNITYSFGKNGWGLSDELIKIGKDIKKLSKDNNVYIDNMNIDTIDDVYDLTISAEPINEGAWGTGILQNDAALDYQSSFGTNVLKILVNDINKSNNPDSCWSKLGVLIDFIKKFDDDELRFTDEYNQSIDFAKMKLKELYHNESWLGQWESPKEMKNELKKNYDDLNSIKYNKNIMNQDNIVTEEDGGGATSADASGAFIAPMNTPIQRRTIYMTQEQVDKLKEAVEVDTAFGNFGYDAPAFKKKNDPAYDHKNIMKKSFKQ